jgi:hypothetical protein
MSYNDKKIVQVLMDAVEKIDERCPGYRKDFKSLLAEVINIENNHRISATNVVQQIADQVNTAGMALYHSQSQGKGSTGN